MLLRVGVSSKDPGKALRIEYDLPPKFDWGNWLSVRKEFEKPMDLSGYTGFELRMRIDVPTTKAFLRITLCDLESNTKNENEEMWWFDAKKSMLSNKRKLWITLRVPFVSFAPSHGAGTRHNDGKLNLHKITAYEINVVSDAGARIMGVLEVDSLRTY